MRQMRQMRQTPARTRGFTLIEIMVVVVILAILGTFAVSNIFDRPDQARITKAQHDIRTLESALEMYRMDNFVYPSSDQGLRALVERPQSSPEPRNWRSGGYMRTLPQDPWGNDYVYLGADDTGGRPLILSYGADGQSGGEGVNAEIRNIDLQ